MKILMIPSWYGTPAAPLLGSFYKEQAEALAARGHQVAVLYAEVGSDFSPSHNGVMHSVVNGVNTYISVHPNFTPGSEKGRCCQRTGMLDRLYRKLEKEWGRPDVVNLRSSLQGYEAVELCRRHHLPLFFMEHSSFVRTEADGSPALRRLAAVMTAADVNACVSHPLAEVMQPRDPSLRLIPDLVDETRFSVGAKSSTDVTFVFAAMGQLRPIKGHDTLIRAFARLQQLTERPVALRIAGTGVLKEYLQGIIDENHLEASCKLVGPIPRREAANFFNDCDCFVCSSRTEMLSCVLMECGACGRPAIATRCGGPQDILTDVNGILVPVDDVDAMAQAMLTMLYKAPTYDRQAIRAQTIERFGMEKVTGLLEQACSDAIRGYKEKENG